MRRLCPECNELIDENGACSAGCPNNEFDSETHCTECGELYEDCECEDLEEEVEEEEEE